MKLKTPAIFFFLLLLAPVANAGYDQRLGAHVSHQEWAEFYADTALRQVRQGRQSHCSFRGGHWEPDYYTHFNWAIRNSSHKGWVVIDRRDAALAKCRSRYGYSYNYRDPGHHYVRPNYRNFWRDFRHGARHYANRKHGRSHRDYGHRGNRHGYAGSRSNDHYRGRGNNSHRRDRGHDNHGSNRGRDRDRDRNGHDNRRGGDRDRDNRGGRNRDRDGRRGG